MPSRWSLLFLEAWKVQLWRQVGRDLKHLFPVLTSCHWIGVLSQGVDLPGKRTLVNLGNSFTGQIPEGFVPCPPRFVLLWSHWVLSSGTLLST